MLDIPLIRWGQPYDSLEKDSVVHFETGEELAQVSQANAGMVQRDMRKQQRAPRPTEGDPHLRAPRDDEEGG